MARVININSANIIELAYKIQKLDSEVGLKYRNILVKAFKGAENTLELIFLKDTVEVNGGMAANLKRLSFVHNTNLSL
jgi:hypothetical protein